MREGDWASLTGDDSQLPLRVFVANVLLFVTGVLGGLWQVADPRVPLFILMAVVPLGILGRLSPRVLSALPITVCQYGLAAASVFWGTYRLAQVPPDLALTEAVAVLGLVMICGRASQNMMLGGVGLLLIAYGGIGPRRGIYLPSLVVFLCVGVFLLYRTRTSRLVGDVPVVVPNESEDGAGAREAPSRGEWGYRSVHFGLFLVLWVVFVMLFPASERSFFGLTPVSYDAPDQEPFIDSWRDWLKPEGEGEGDARSQEKASVYQYDGDHGVLVQVEEDVESSMDGRDGSGRFSAMGKERVFRVRCSERLYWLVRLYDQYDGDTWKASQQLQRKTYDMREELLSSSRILVDQNFFIERHSSNFLPGAYRAVRVGWSKRPGLEQLMGTVPGFPTEGGIARVASVGRNGLEYRVSSRMVCTSEAPPAGDMAVDLIKPPSLARRLPKATISRRTRNLAGLLTAGHSDDLAKATALRDYLRTNFTYTLTPPPIPADAEPVDYFLFENRQGFCVHFAQSLVVLARLAGLPARFATGYTPGKYNVLTGTFDVYQYHAHAWCQIWVNPHGWLTFDPTPPSSLDLDSIPPLLGKIWDPFTDDIQSRPPEFSLTRAKEAQRQAEAKIMKAAGERRKQLRELLGEAMKNPQDIDRERLQLIAQKSLMVLFQGAKAFAADLTKRATAWLAWLGGRGKSLLVTLGRMRNALSPTQMAVALAACIIGFVVARRQDAIMERMREEQKRRQCKELWQGLSSWQESTPEVVVTACCRLTCILLELAGHLRRPTEDLLEYAQSLQHRRPDLGVEVQTVFEVFNTYQFGARELTVDHAGIVYRACSRVHQCLATDSR